MTAILGLISLCIAEPEVTRTPAIFRCTVSEAESRWLPDAIAENGFDTLCVDPRPGHNALQVIRSLRVKTMPPSLVDTKQNLSWRDAAIKLLKGQISPKSWISSTRTMQETVHFLSSPNTRLLRTEMDNESARAVQAELFLLSLPGRPCLTSADIGKARQLPEEGPVQSYILSMNDLLGPMLYWRATHPWVVTGKPHILRADPQPGLLIFSQTKGAEKVTIYINTGSKPLPLPPIKQDHVIMDRGLNLDEPKARLMPHGFFIEDLTSSQEP